MEEQSKAPEIPEKSLVNLAANLKTSDLKPSIVLFRKLIEENYANSLRLNVMTGRPELMTVFGKSGANGPTSMMPRCGYGSRRNMACIMKECSGMRCRCTSNFIR